MESAANWYEIYYCIKSSKSKKENKARLAKFNTEIREFKNDLEPHMTEGGVSERWARDMIGKLLEAERMIYIFGEDYHRRYKEHIAAFTQEISSIIGKTLVC